MLYADFHTHSQYAYAVSKKNNIQGFYYASLKKGLGLLSTGDALHPEHWKELDKLIEINNTGFYSVEGKPEVKFVFGGEVSLFFKHEEKQKKIHLCFLSPSKSEVQSLKDDLKEYNLKSDGRPILKTSVHDFCTKVFNISEEFLVFPAHVWTPWFGILGEKSGFDNLTNAFREYEPLIKAIEMGMSSDCEMNARIPFLESKRFLANSDAHSLDLLRWGRECNAFNRLDNYNELKKSFEVNSTNFSYVVKVDPAYGRYHYCGHKDCNYSQESQGICPKCGKILIRGVASRVNELSDSVKRKVQKNYKIMPLKEVVALALNKKPASKIVERECEKLLEKDAELKILLENKIEGDDKISEMILLNREGKIKFKPGYDGMYGIPIML